MVTPGLCVGTLGTGEFQKIGTSPGHLLSTQISARSAAGLGVGGWGLVNKTGSLLPSCALSEP